MNKRCRLVGTSVALAAVFAGIFLFGTNSLKSTPSPEMMPWGSVGGCGAGGSGGAGASAKWIGTGVTGGLLDVQVMYGSTASKTSNIGALETRMSIHPTYTSTLALTLPVLGKTGVVQQPSSAYDISPGGINNGMGDIRIDWQDAFGLSGQFSYNFTLTAPTGTYAETFGSDKSKNYLPSYLQLGTGCYNLSLDLGYTKDFDKAMLLIDAIYSHPFALNFSGESDLYGKYSDPMYTNWDALPDVEKKRFRYYFKPYGENDLGAYFPPSVTLSAFYGTKAIEEYVHSFGAMFTVPIGVAWKPDVIENSYKPIPDPDNQVWTLTLCYGLEVTRPNFPLFFAAYIPIHSKTASATNAQANDPYNTAIMARLTGPDWKDILHRWSVFVGTKTTLF
jgi:hypothetical protein